MDDPRIHLRQLRLVESRRRAAEAGEVERGDQRCGIDHRLDRIARPDPREQRDDRLRLDPRVAKMRDAQRSQTLGQFALGAGQQRFVREGGWRDAHRIEHLQLQRGVGHMVFAAHDMGDAQIGIVDRRWQHIQPRSVGAAHDGIAHRLRIEALGPADQIVPMDRCVMIQLEPPVRRDAIRLKLRLLRIAQRQRRAIVHRWQAAPEQDLALQIEFLCALIGRIDAPRRDQCVEPRLIQRESLRLAHLGIGRQAQPGEIGADAVDEPLLGPLGIGVVDAQHEPPALPPREHPIVQPRPDIADVEHAGGRGREAGDDGHARAPTAAGGRSEAVCERRHRR